MPTNDHSDADRQAEMERRIRERAFTLGVGGISRRVAFLSTLPLADQARLVYDLPDDDDYVELLRALDPGDRTALVAEIKRHDDAAMAALEERRRRWADLRP